jgi:hypothetical protein
VLSIGPVVNERVEELHAMGSFSTVAIFVDRCCQLFVPLVIFLDGFDPFFAFPVSRNLVQNVYLIIGSFKVMLGTFLDFDSYVRIVLKIFGKPDC